MSDMLLCAAVSALAFVSPRAFVGPSLVSLPRPLLVAHDGHLRAHRAAAPFTRHQGCRLSAGTGPVPESDEDTTCPTDGPGMMELARFTLPTLSHTPTQGGCRYRVHCLTVTVFRGVRVCHSVLS